MLTDARAKAGRIVEGLVRQRDEMALPTRGLVPAHLAEGRALVDEALAAATRTLAALDQAWRRSSASGTEIDGPPPTHRG
jgi:hypothetical protein